MNIQKVKKIERTKYTSLSKNDLENRKNKNSKVKRQNSDSNFKDFNYYLNEKLKQK